MKTPAKPTRKDAEPIATTSRGGILADYWRDDHDQTTREAFWRRAAYARRDNQVIACMQQRLDAVVSYEWQIEAAQEAGNEETEAMLARLEIREVALAPLVETNLHRILDFGVEHGYETAILRDMGVQVTAFEPYPQVRNRVDIDAGKTSARQLLEAVEKGTEWDTIFLASVFNAVPFLADRQYIVTICAALCSAHTRLFACARSIRDSVWESVKSGSGLSCRTRNLQAFPVDFGGLARRAEDGAIVFS